MSHAGEGPLVAIGIGNVLRGDDAAGVRVIEGLRSAAGRDPAALPPGTRLVDGGTVGLELLDTMRGARGVVLVDAVRMGGPAGRVSVLDEAAVVSIGGSPDGTAGSAVGELLAVARLMAWLPERVAMVGIEAGDLGVGRPLTPAVDAAIPEATGLVVDELHRMDAARTAGTRGGAATGLAGART